VLPSSLEAPDFAFLHGDVPVSATVEVDLRET